MWEATIIGVSIFAVMMASQYGNRDYTWHKVVYPLISVGVFGWIYLSDAPLSTPAGRLYLVGALIGLGFGVLATKFTGVIRDELGQVRTICGTGFVVTWLVALVLRLAFIWSVTNVSSFRTAVGEFMYANGIVEDAIAPFFVIMALVMVASRIAMIRYRVSHLPQVTAAPAALVAA